MRKSTGREEEFHELMRAGAMSEENTFELINVYGAMSE